MISKNTLALTKTARAFAEDLVLGNTPEAGACAPDSFLHWVVSCRCMEWTMRSWTRSRYAPDSLIHAQLKQICQMNDLIRGGVYPASRWTGTKAQLYGSALSDKWVKVFRDSTTVAFGYLFDYLRGFTVGKVDFSAMKNLMDALIWSNMPRGPYHNHIPRSTFLIHYHAIRAGISVPDTEIEVV